MHIYFSGIGGTGIGPLALIAKQAGYEVSGSDKQDSQYIGYLKKHGLTNIHIGQTAEAIAKVHREHPIDWLVYSSAVVMENKDHPEIGFAREYGIKISKRDELLNKIMADHNIKLVAVAGTHGKSTVTAMAIWLFKQFDIPVSYSVGAKIDFGDMGAADLSSQYFVLEADEYDYNFLAFRPYMSLITGLDWDHPDIYPTREQYFDAFREFIGQSEHAALWQSDISRLNLKPTDHQMVLDDNDPKINKLLELTGEVNRRNAWLTANGLGPILNHPADELAQKLNNFPGLSRRFEQIVPGLYSDYAHTPSKIRGALQMAHEVLNESKQATRLDGVQGAGEQRTELYKNGSAKEQSQPATSQSAKSASGVDGSAGKQAGAARGLVVVYEGLHNLRQHFIKDELKNLFEGVKQLYIVPSYLAREDKKLELLTPQKLVDSLSDKTRHHAKPAALDENLKKLIEGHLDQKDLVLCLSAGGGGSLDEWLHRQFQ